jgi:hypothetical protein
MKIMKINQYQINQGKYYSYKMWFNGLEYIKMVINCKTYKAFWRYLMLFEANGIFFVAT